MNEVVARETEHSVDALHAIKLCGVRLHAVTAQQAIEMILTRLKRGEGGWVVTPNLDIVRRCVRDRSFRELTEPADLMLADGAPLIWASRLQGTPLPERVAGSDLIFTLSEAAASHGARLYLLGGDHGTAEQAGRVLAEKYPGLVIAGHDCPPVGFEKDETMLATIERRLVAAEPDIVYVALGCPKQEWLIDRMRSTLPRAWWLGIGISFSFVTGRVRRAPRWMQRVGLEWLHRLCQEPRRLARRYLIEGIPFAIRLFARVACVRCGLAGTGYPGKRAADVS